MKGLQLKINPAAKAVFDNYPKAIRKKMLALRELIINTAKELDGLDHLEEPLRWGEPSYITKKGSTFRIDWKPKTPHQYAMYFQCTSKLVETFKLVFKNTFQYEGKRAIVFGIDDPFPTEALQHCIKAALTYHSIKHLPTLGL